MSFTGDIVSHGMRFYRLTLKRVQPIHALSYRSANTVVNLISKATRLETIQDDPLWFRLELITGAYESETVDVIRKLAKPGMTALDIGAHIGYYTKLLSSLVRVTGRVIAFEPHPRTFPVLCRNVHSMPNVTPMEIAVTDREGDFRLYDYLPESGSSSLRVDTERVDALKNLLAGRELAPRVVAGFPQKSYSIRTTSIDSYLVEAGITRVDLIKMDIEGAEVTALRGMERTLSSSGQVSLIMEFFPRLLRAFGTDPLEVWTILRSFAFRVTIIAANHGLEPITDANSFRALCEALERPKTARRVNLLCQRG